MSFFQSGPYQSQVLRSFVRQTRRWIDQGAVALRRLKIAASWSAQILLYPVYAVFQMARLAGAAVQSVAESGLPSWRVRLHPPQQDSSTPPATPFTADRAIQQALLTVQQLLLPTRLPAYLPEQGPCDRGPVSLALASTGELVVGQSDDRDLNGSAATGVALKTASPLPGRSRSSAPAAFIRGIASDLETRAIVLVTNHNQALNLLTAEQQQILQQRITWETTHYERYLSFRQTTRQWLSRFTSSPEEDASPQPRGILQRLADWGQSDRVQQAGASVWQFLQTSWLRLRSLKSAQPPSQPILPAAEVPIQQALLMVQQLSLLGELPPLVTSLAAGVTPDEIKRLMGVTGDVTVWAEQFSQVAPVEPGESSLQSSPSSAILIRGIASDLATQAIVLVTIHNQILDLLTPEQQQILRRRIIWDVASYRRHLNLQRLMPRVFARLRLPRQPNHLLPPVRAFHRLMAWMQTGPVAIAVNLFQEASLPSLELESMAVPALPPERKASLPRPIHGPTSGFMNRLAYPIALLSRATALLALPFQPTQPIHSTEASLDGSAAAALSMTACSTLVLDSTAGTAAVAASSIAGRSLLAQPANGSVVNSAGEWEVDSRSPDFIEAEARLLGYEQSLLERVLRWLDRVLLWIEAAIVAIWRQLRGYF